MAEKSMRLIKGVVVMERAGPADKGRMVMKLFPTSRLAHLHHDRLLLLIPRGSGRAREIFFYLCEESAWTKDFGGDPTQSNLYRLTSATDYTLSPKPNFVRDKNKKNQG